MTWDGNYYLYFIAAKRKVGRKYSRYEYVKIGHAKDIKKRFTAIDYMCPLKLKLICYFKSPNKKEILGAESALKKLCSHERVKGEWYFLYSEEAIQQWFVMNAQGKISREAIWV